jgi:transposase
MKKNITETPKMSRTKRLSRGRLTGSLTVGIDLGDRSSRYCILNEDGDVVEARAVATTRKDLTRVFGALRRSRLALEVGTHSPWVSRHLQVLGHEVIVANPRRTRLIAESDNKHDRVDAETLARLARADPKLLFPIRHRGEQAQADLAVIRVRAALVEARTRSINTARGLTKSFGERLRKCDAQSVDERLAEDLPPALQAVVAPLLAQARELNARIREHDETIQKIARERYPETALLTAVYGVGVLMALTFILTIDDRSRFARSRDVGAYLGMRPRRWQSSGSDPALGISKAGDRYLRKLLVQGAHVILGRHGADSDLRRFGRKLAERGGKGANKKARVAVARKLAVLLHHLWVTGEVYAPLHHTSTATVAAAA